jgi:hypothetical protein
MQPLMRRFLSSLAMLVALSAMPLCAQTYGEITGHIADSSGTVAPGTQIALTNHRKCLSLLGDDVLSTYLIQQSHRLETATLQSLEVASYSRGIAHTG